MDKISAKTFFTSRLMEQQWSRMQGIKMFRSGFTVNEVAKFLMFPRELFLNGWLHLRKVDKKSFWQRTTLGVHRTSIMNKCSGLLTQCGSAQQYALSI